VQRHLSSPLLQERLEYLQHCANQGYALTALRGLASDLLLIQNLLGLTTSSDSLGLADVQAAWADGSIVGPGTLGTKTVDAVA